MPRALAGRGNVVGLALPRNPDTMMLNCESLAMKGAHLLQNLLRKTAWHVRRPRLLLKMLHELLQIFLHVSRDSEAEKMHTSQQGERAPRYRWAVKNHGSRFTQHRTVVCVPWHTHRKSITFMQTCLIFSSLTARTQAGMEIKRAQLRVLNLGRLNVHDTFVAIEVRSCSPVSSYHKAGVVVYR